MSNKFDWRSAVPHVIIVAVFFLITFFFFQPLFNGKALKQHDILQHKGMSKEIADHREKYHEEPLWTNSMFCGMPAYQISVLYKNNFSKYFDNVFSLGISSQARYLLLYLFGFYLLMLSLGVKPWVGAVGAIAFAFSSYFLIIIEAGHNSKAHAIGYMAPALAGVVLAFRGRLLLGGLFTALFLALELYANHLQITYYLMFVILAFGIAELINAIKEDRVLQFFKASAAVAAGAIIALGMNAGNLLTTLDYSKHTTRGTSELTIGPDGRSNEGDKTSGLDKNYATGWSYGKAETMTFLIPDFKGGASVAIGKDKDALKEVDPQMQGVVSQMERYWGDQPGTSGPVYLGAIIMFLAVFGLFIIKGPVKWALFGVTVLAIMLGWGRNFDSLSWFFLDHFPGYNKFRTVSMILVIAELTVPIFAALALNEIISNPNIFKEQVKIFGNAVTRQRLLIIAFALTAGLCLFFFLSPGSTRLTQAGELDSLTQQVLKSSPDTDRAGAESYAARILDELQVARKQILRSDAGRSMMFILAAGLIIFGYVRLKFNKWILVAGIGLLVLADMWAVNMRYFHKEKFVAKREMQVPYNPSAANEAILQDHDPSYRVLNLAANTFNEAGTSYFHQSLGGYHGAKLKRYQEMIEFYLSGDINSIITTLQTTPTDSAINQTLSEQGTLNMLNARYIIYNPSAPPLQNKHALGNAWFVGEMKMAKNADEEIMQTGKIDPAKTALINETFKEDISGFNPSKAEGTIKLTSYKANELVYESNSTAEQLAVFSEIWYPAGWKATIDGKDASHFRANYVLRAMRIPAGKHTIQFRFEPSVYHTGETISLASSVLLILLLLGGAFIGIRKTFASK
jgi:hypothetical protein